MTKNTDPRELVEALVGHKFKFLTAEPYDLEDAESCDLMEATVDAVRAQRYGPKAKAEVVALQSYLGDLDFRRPATQPARMENTFNIEGTAREVAGFLLGLELGRRLGGAPERRRFTR